MLVSISNYIISLFSVHLHYGVLPCCIPSSVMTSFSIVPHISQYISRRLMCRLGWYSVMQLDTDGCIAIMRQYVHSGNEHAVDLSQGDHFSNMDVFHSIRWKVSKKQRLFAPKKEIQPQDCSTNSHLIALPLTCPMNSEFVRP